MTFPFPTVDAPWLLWEGDCLLGMAELPERCIDAVVTDPPYAIRIAAWDAIASLYEFTLAWARYAFRVMKPGAYLVSFAATRTYHRMVCAIEDAGFEIRDQLTYLFGSGMPRNNATCLKPAHEPIVLARKPRSGAAGALNTEACRVGGRFPANVLLDEDAAALLDEQAPDVGADSPVRGTEPSAASKNVYNPRARVVGAFHGDHGGASRFMYCAKASKAERQGSAHPSVKPVSLMRWLCRLVTPPGGLVLDPFAGTGTTAQAAIEEGFRAILCEQEPQYVADINRRLSAKATA